MRLKYTKKELMDTFYKIVSQAEHAFVKQNYSDCINLIKSAAEYQFNINIILSEKRLDDLIIKLSDNRQVYSEEFEPIENHVILYDSFALDNRGLTQQYLDALCYSGKYKILLLHNTCFGDDSQNIEKYCHDNNIELKELGNGSYEEREKKLLDIILSFRPGKVFYHLYPSDVLPLATFYAFKSITSYQINLTDHAFWLGADLIDYCFEFRNWGATLSNNRRNIKRGKLLLLPYYPWQENIPFQGFPNEVAGKIILFAGGSLYKIEGGNGLFYTIIKRILIDNPNVIFLYAGDGDRTSINKFIDENQFEDRVLLLGNRTDINEVVKHIDIYINTYPMIGGLMSQFAAINAKPILTFKDKQVEDVVCIKHPHSIAIDGLDDLLTEANKLIRDNEYRKQMGELMKSLIIDQGDFRRQFYHIMQNENSQETIQDVDIDNSFYDAYINRLNEGKLGLNLEKMIKTNCPSALSLKMRFNLYWPYFRHRVHVFRMKLMGKL